MRDPVDVERDIRRTLSQLRVRIPATVTLDPVGGRITLEDGRIFRVRSFADVDAVAYAVGARIVRTRKVA